MGSSDGWRAGALSEYDLPTPASEPHGLAIGPDGAVWVALEVGTVVRLAAGGPPTSVTPGSLSPDGRTWIMASRP